VVDDGSVFSWGSGRHGELGLGGSQLAAPEPTLVASVRDYDISSVYCGWQHSVFFSSRSGYVFTCGNNRHGQLGVPKASESARSLPAKVIDASGSLLQCSQVAVGWHFVLCLSMDATLVSWGKGSHGQLGLGSLESVEVPTAIRFEDPVASIACGSEHTMVITKQGYLFTCGWGEHGNLGTVASGHDAEAGLSVCGVTSLPGHGDTENRSSLTKVQFFDDRGWQVVSVKAGGAVSIALARRRPTKIMSM
jgi:alpha-tubulin suppressor-like RCC1 family protein